MCIVTVPLPVAGPEGPLPTGRYDLEGGCGTRAGWEVERVWNGRVRDGFRRGEGGENV